MVYQFRCWVCGDQVLQLDLLRHSNDNHSGLCPDCHHQFTRNRRWLRRLGLTATVSADEEGE